MIYKKEKLIDKIPLFSAVGCVCFCDNEILLLRRNKDKSYPGLWGVPTGKIVGVEKPIHAIVRELYEETSILLSESRFVFVSDFYVDAGEMFFEYVLYYVEFSLMPDVIINLKEHDEYRWVRIELVDSIDLVVDVKETLKMSDKLRKINNTRQLDLFVDDSNYVKKIIRLQDYLEDYSGISLRDKTQKKWYVSFGPPGSGKTTALKRFSEKYSDYHLLSDNKMILKTDTRLKRYLDRAVKDGKYLYYFYFQMEVIVDRFKKSLNSPNNSLVDETIFSTLAYSVALYKLGWIGDDEFNTFMVNYKVYAGYLPEPELIIYCHAKYDVLMKRIESRGRKIEKNYTINYLQALCGAFEEVSFLLKKMGYKIIDIDTEKHSAIQVIKILEDKIRKK